MTIRTNTDLGASFERLKKAMKEADEMLKENTPQGLTSAYAKLYANTEYFINEFDDDRDDVPKDLFTSPGVTS